MKKILLKINTLSLTFIGFLTAPIIALAEECIGGVDEVTGKLKYCALEPNAFGEVAVTTSLGAFLSQAFQFGLAIAAALAVIMIVWGGVEIMISESMGGKLDGKAKIWDAIWGLGLALVSWLILYIINPDILNFKL